MFPAVQRSQSTRSRRVGSGRLRAAVTESGQATVEYALVVLAAAAVALLVIAWAARTGKVGELLDRVFDQVVARAG